MSGLVVVVTGAGGGIGAGIADVLRDRGDLVVGIDRENQEPNVTSCDLRSTEQVDALVAEVVAEHGRLDGLVNNAAVGPLGTVTETDDATLEEIVDVNLKGTFRMARAALRHMLPRGAGSIVNIGSGAGHGKPNMAAYAASKAAVHALSASMAYDHFHQGIRVNTVVPGGGGIVSGISLGRFGGSADDYLALPHSGSVAGRPVGPADVGQTVAFLLSPAAAAISGTVIDVGCMANQGGPLPGKIGAS